MKYAPFISMCPTKIYPKQLEETEKDFWHYTTPVLGNELVWGCGFTMFSVIMGHLGSDAVAANSVANILKILSHVYVMESESELVLLSETSLEKARWNGPRNTETDFLSLRYLQAQFQGLYFWQ